ncbi:MAG: hypothetical protein K2L82_11940 [Lachnospiraceae bacterium]|nr:hypothetical protein [Lachnospiraceae bacterium]
MSEMKGNGGNMENDGVKQLSIKSRILIGVILFLLLSANLLYWGSRKEGFFCDELYSYHFTSQLQYPYLVADRENETWLNQWHSSDYFQDYLTLTKEEVFDFSGVWKTIIADVHPPFFYLLLNFSSSVFSMIFPGIFTKWSGIFVNIWFFMMTMYFLWKLSKEVTESDFWSVMVCILYGFSAGAVSTVVFIRMYMVFTCFAVLFTYLNALLWKAVWMKDKKENGWIYPLLSLTAFMGIMTQYYFLIYAFFICIVIWGYSLWRRNYFFAVKYAVSMGVSIAAVCLIWSDILNDIFSGYRGEEAFGNLAAGEGWFTALPQLFAVIDGELFGKGALLLLAFAVGLLFYRVLSVWWSIKKSTAEDGSIHILLEKRERRTEFELRFTMQDIIFVQILAAVFLYIVLISKIAPYKEDRYVFPIFPMIILLVVFLAKKLTAGMVKNVTYAVCIVMLGCMLLGYLSPGVNYLYRGTKERLNTVSMYSDLPVFYITSGSSYRACGESVYFSKAKHTYPVRGELLGVIPEALQAIDDGEKSGCLFYIDLNYENQDVLVQEISVMFSGRQMRYLFDTEYSAVYIIE